ncbi:hypothetical protein CONLIGDRAFT_695182 [Coniochaeta ligniaria NRRL 30616]|uniref:Glyoxalase-like domain-containing protein n=1 Tax=Coniochaeta ligniaria NRRL 30616 TaxID=1408157 RepID=A0A1J7JYL0_9PEZI|nr:hypothetical protein CONLIGDRAFT_695182 [Coniochaeta ligniaria NRRL 30616]
MSQRVSSPVLDHIVILVSSHFLANIPSWLTDSLTILPGGTHADGLTENKLIVLEDGVYFELIAFVEGVDPDKRRSHRWGQSTEGQIIDWACTLLQEGSDANPEEQFTAVQDRIRSAQTGFNYTDPVPGGRITPDGTLLKWAISTAHVDKTGPSVDLQLAGGELPFWCIDRTPRHVRVPHTNPDNVKHPSGAVGVATVSVFVKGSDKVSHLRHVYDAIANKSGKLLAVEGVDSAYNWKVEVPFPNSGTHSGIILRKWSEESLDTRSLTSEEVHISIALFTRDRSGRLEGSIGKDRHLVIDLIPLAEKDLA